MLTNCFRFAPRDSVPGLIAKICKYLKDHPGWSEEELEEQIKQFIGQTGVESFNGRTGAVVLNEDDVNNLKIASAYFAEGDDTIDELDLVTLYNQGVRFVFTNWNSVTSGYDLAFVLDYFSGSNDVVYYPMATGSGGGGNIISVNGKTGIVELSLSDILGDSGAQVKLCTATEFTSTTLTTWNAYYEDGYRVIGVINSDASAIDYIYLLKQDENNHQPIGLSVGASDAYTPANPPPYPVKSVNGRTGIVTGLYDAQNPPPYPVTSVNGKTGQVAVKEVDVTDKDEVNENVEVFVNESENYPPFTAQDSENLGGKPPSFYRAYENILDNSDFTRLIAQAGVSGEHAGVNYAADRWKLVSGTVSAVENSDGYGYSSFTLNGTISQIVDKKPSTFSVFINMISGDGEIAFDPSSGVVTITSNGGVIGNAMLFEVDLSIKPDYTPKNFFLETLKCQKEYIRFYNIDGRYRVNLWGTGVATLALSVPNAMIKKPSVVYSNVRLSNLSQTFTINSAKVDEVKGNLVEIEFAGTGGTTYNTSYFLQTLDTSKPAFIDLCADRG